MVCFQDLNRWRRPSGESRRNSKICVEFVLDRRQECVKRQTVEQNSLKAQEFSFCHEDANDEIVRRRDTIDLIPDEHLRVIARFVMEGSVHQLERMCKTPVGRSRGDDQDFVTSVASSC